MKEKLEAIREAFSNLRFLASRDAEDYALLNAADEAKESLTLLDSLISELKGSCVLCGVSEEIDIDDCIEEAHKELFCFECRKRIYL